MLKILVLEMIFLYLDGNFTSIDKEASMHTQTFVLGLFVLGVGEGFKLP